MYKNILNFFVFTNSGLYYRVPFTPRVSMDPLADGN